MSSINTRSLSTTGLSVSTSRVTIRQDAAQARIVAAGNRAQAASDGVSAAEAARNQAQDQLDALASKPKGKDYEKKFEAAMATLNMASQNLEAAKREQQAAKQELLAAKDALPAAIAADNQATQVNEAADKKRSDQVDSQERKAQEDKESNEKSKTDDGSKPQPPAQAQGRGRAPAPTDVVGAALGGGVETQSAPEAQAPEGAPAPRAEQQDGYSPSAPKSSGDSRQAGRAAGGSTGVLTDEETQGSGRAPARFLATASKPSVGTAPAPQGTGSAAQGSTTPSIGNALAYVAGGSGDDDVVTDSGKRYSELTPALKALVDETKKEVLQEARKGLVKAIQDSFMSAFSKLGGESGLAEEDDTQGKSSSKGEKKKGVPQVGLGAAGKGKALASGATVGGSPTSLTPAGNGAASAATGATGATVGASDRPAVQQFAAAQSGKPMVGSSLQGSGKSAAGKATIGASPTVGATGSDGLYDPIQYTANSEIGKAYTGGMSPMELVQMVMLKAFQEAGEDVRNAAEMMQKQTDAKAKARQGQNALREMVNYDDNGTLSSVAVDGNQYSAKEASNKLSSIDGNIDAIGDDNQVLMIRLQNLTQLMTTMSQAASNMSKSAYDTTKSVIGQIGH